MKVLKTILLLFLIFSSPLFSHAQDDFEHLLKNNCGLATSTTIKYFCIWSQFKIRLEQYQPQWSTFTKSLCWQCYEDITTGWAEVNIMKWLKVNDGS